MEEAVELIKGSFGEVMDSLKRKYMKDRESWAKFGETQKGKRIELKYKKFSREVSLFPTETEKQKLEKLVKATDERVEDYKEERVKEIIKK
jgi:hypothetical protein